MDHCAEDGFSNRRSCSVNGHHPRLGAVLVVHVTGSVELDSCCLGDIQTVLGDIPESNGVLLGCLLRYPARMASIDPDDDYIACPHCGAELGPTATFCSECGSSDADGWSTEADVGGDDFDYEDYVAANFSESSVNRETPALWRWVAVVLLILFLFACLAIWR